MDKFSELIAYMKKVRESTPEGEPSCKDGEFERRLYGCFQIKHGLDSQHLFKSIRYRVSIPNRG